MDLLFGGFEEVCGENMLYNYIYLEYMYCIVFLSFFILWAFNPWYTMEIYKRELEDVVFVSVIRPDTY